MTDYITRHEDVLSIVTVIDDPIYLDEPYVQSTTYVYDRTGVTATEVCNGSAFAENGGTNRHHVPHFLPGQNTALTEWLKIEDWVPPEPARGGVKTIYPEYKSTFSAPAGAGNLRVPSSRSAAPPDKRVAGQSPRDGQVHVMPVQGNIYMMVADGTNITASIGPQGVMLVNTGSAEMTEKLRVAVNELASSVAAGARPNQCFGPNCSGIGFGWSSPYINSIISSPSPPKPNTSAETKDSPPRVSTREAAASAPLRAWDGEHP
jgi:hypothetical protein